MWLTESRTENQTSYVSTVGVGLDGCVSLMTHQSPRSTYCNRAVSNSNKTVTVTREVISAVHLCPTGDATIIMIGDTIVQCLYRDTILELN